MKKNFCNIIVMVAILVPLNAHGNENALIRNTLQSLFSVLQSGNITAIEALLGGNLHKQKKNLLKNNREYSKFLRQYYKGAKFQIDKVTRGGDQATIDASVIFPDGKSEQISLRLSKDKVPDGLAKDKVPGIWRIVDDITMEQDIAK